MCFQILQISKENRFRDVCWGKEVAGSGRELVRGNSSICPQVVCSDKRKMLARVLFIQDQAWDRGAVCRRHSQHWTRKHLLTNPITVWVVQEVAIDLFQRALNIGP